MGLISRVSSRTYRTNEKKSNLNKKMATAQQIDHLQQETDDAMMDIQQSIEQADKTLEKQGLGDSPTAAKIRGLVDSMRDQRKKLLANMNDRKLTFADQLEKKAEAGDQLASRASDALFGTKGNTFSAIRSVGSSSGDNQSSSPKSSPRSILKKSQIPSLNSKPKK